MMQLVLLLLQQMECTFRIPDAAGAAAARFNVAAGAAAADAGIRPKEVVTASQ